MSDLFEFEEADDARPIENSPLIETHCRTCGAKALAVPAYVRMARCAACALTESGADGQMHGVPGPVVRYGTFAIPPTEVIRAAYLSPTYVGPVLDMIGDEPELDGIVPQPVLSLAEYARENSWEVRSQYTRGHFPHGTTGRPGAEHHVISLRFGGHPMTDRQAYAVYRSPVSKTAWTWGSIAVWGPDFPPYLGCGVTELKTFLLTEGGAQSVHEWLRDLKDAADARETFRKAREIKRAEIKREFGKGMTVEALALLYGESVDDVRKMYTKRGAAKEGAS